MCRQLREFNPRRSEPPSFPPLSRNRQITWPRGGISVAVSPPPGFARRQVRLGDIGVQLDSVAGLVLNGEIAVLPEWALAHHKVRPPVHPVGQLVEAEFAHGGGSVARRDGSHGAGGVVARSVNVPSTPRVQPPTVGTS